MTNIGETYQVSVDTRGSVDSQLENTIKRNDPFISDEIRHLLEIIFFVVVNGVVSIFGSAANVINMIIFFKQGFSDSVNISLIGLAISDLGALLTLVWKSICMNPLFRYSDIDFDSGQIQIITAGWPHRCLVTITSWITAFITFERCVCIALPLKVKEIITPKRKFISLAAIFIIMFAIFSPFFCSVDILLSFNVKRNKTLHIFSYTSSGLVLHNISNSVIISVQLCSFTILTICTVILIYTLFTKSRWRQKATAASSSGMTDSVSSRDKRIMKMVAFISCIFIACFLPNAVNLIIIEAFADYNSHGRYQNSLQVTWAMLSTLEVVNCSASIIVYYKMSSKYRTCFKQLFFKKI